MNFNNISKTARTLAIFTFSILLIQACTKPENSVGSGFLGGELFETGIYRGTKLLSFTSQEPEIPTSGTTNSMLGAYQDQNFGMIRASFASQLGLSKEDPTFGENATVDSVILTIPYLGKAIGDSILVYDTDSIYGSYTTPINIRIAELTKYLFKDSTYYSDVDLPSSNEVYSNPNFKPDYKTVNVDGQARLTLDSLTLYEHDRNGEVIDTNVIAPAFRVHLDKNFFQQRVIDMEGTPVLASNVSFIQNFNGLVFETSSTDGAVFSFKLLEGSTLTIHYKNDEKDEDDELLEPQEFGLVFSNSYVKVNKYEFDTNNAHPSLVQQLTPGYDTTQGSDMLFMQGMSGLRANVKLFLDSIQLDTLRQQKWLINEASIVYRVSSDNGNAINPPYRLFMANRDSLAVGGDYRLDDEVYNSLAYDGIMRNDPKVILGESRVYKFRVTHHVSSILNGSRTTTSEGDSIIYGDNFPILLLPGTGAESPARVMVNSNLSSNNGNGDKDLYLEIIYSKKEN